MKCEHCGTERGATHCIAALKARAEKAERERYDAQARLMTTEDRKASDDAIRELIAEADALRAELAIAVEALREVLPVLVDCACHAGYVVGGDGAVKILASKYPRCPTCVSAADHEEHARAACERVDAALAHLTPSAPK